MSDIVERLDEAQRKSDALGLPVAIFKDAKAEIEQLRAQVALLAGRVRNAHTLLEHDEDHKAMVLLAETWLEHKSSFPSTDGK